jgi:protein-S-isoprenylcysteine O-methyltransferase Ste14
VPDWSRIARRIRVPLGFAFAVLYLWFARPTWSSILLGTIIAIPGIGLRALASGHVKKNEELTTSGPYAYTRNPLYLGSLIMALGFAIAARSIWVVFLMLLMFFAI